MRYIHTMVWYSTLKKFLQYVTCMNFEDVMRRRISKATERQILPNSSSMRYLVKTIGQWGGGDQELGGGRNQVLLINGR